MSTKEPTTLSQIPKTAADYYRSAEQPLFPGYRRVLLGMDDLGRRVYQAQIDGEDYGSPRALLSFAEYKKKVREWAKLSPSMGVQRFTTPTYRNPT